MFRPRNIPAILSMLLLIAACSGQIDRYSEFRQLPEKGWAYGDSVEFMTIADGLERAKSMTIAVRHNDSFLFRNLWVEVSYSDSAGIQRTDSINIELADPLGRWKGTGIGSAYQCEAHVAHRVSVADSSVVKVRHIMRLDTVRGIEKIGLTIE